MSLINDMLRDLEARRRKESQQAVLSSSPSAVGRRRGGRWLLLSLLGGGLLLVATVLLVMAGGLSLGPDEAGTKLASAEVVGNEDVVKVLMNNPESVDWQPVEKRAVADDQAGIDNEPSKGREEVAPPERERRLERLTVREEPERAQMQLDFSSSPRYRLLQSGPEMAEMIVGFNEVRLGKELDIPEVKGTIFTGISFRPRHDRLEMIVGLAGRAVVREIAVAETPEGLSRLTVDIVALQESQDEPKSRLQPDILPEKSQQTAGKESVAGGEPVAEGDDTDRKTATMSKKLNVPTPAKQAYLDGIDLMRRKRFEAAEKSFSKALQLRPDFTVAGLQLAEALVRQGKVAQAEEFLQKAVEKRPSQWRLRKKYARLLAAGSNIPQAVAVLRRSPQPEPVQDLEYHALLAALLQEAEDYEGAAGIYGRLLRLRPEETVWWLGLAVSLDQMKNYQRAQAAYERALALPGLSPKLRQYAQGRLQALE